MIITLQLAPSDLDAIAAEVAKRNKPQSALTVAEVAQTLGISTSTARNRIKAGVIKAIPNIGAMRVARAEMDRVLSNQ